MKLHRGVMQSAFEKHTCFSVIQVTAEMYVKKFHPNITYFLSWVNFIFQKNGRDFEKLQRALNPMELAASMNNLTKEQRLEYLEKTFQETVEEYSKVIERLGMASD